MKARQRLSVEKGKRAAPRVPIAAKEKREELLLVEGALELVLAHLIVVLHPMPGVEYADAR